jgi:hypothetical protein
MRVELVPDVALGGNGTGSLVDLLLSRIATSPRSEARWCPAR